MHTGSDEMDNKNKSIKRIKIMSLFLSTYPFIKTSLIITSPTTYLSSLLIVLLFQLLDETYFRSKVSVPIITTAFGDVITIEEGEYIGIVKYKVLYSKIIWLTLYLDF